MHHERLLVRFTGARIHEVDYRFANAIKVFCPVFNPVIDRKYVDSHG